jgi:hypothetical protein
MNNNSANITTPKKETGILGFFVPTRSDYHSLIQEAPELLNVHQKYNILDLKSMREFNIATRGEYKNMVKNARIDRDKANSAKKRYKQNPENAEKIKKYNNRPDIKARKADLQRKRAAVLKHLKEKDPEYYVNIITNLDKTIYGENSASENVTQNDGEEHTE